MSRWWVGRNAPGGEGEWVEVENENRERRYREALEEASQRLYEGQPTVAKRLIDEALVDQEQDG